MVIPSTMDLSRVRRKRLALGTSPPVARPKDRRFGPWRTRHAHLHSVLVFFFEATTTPRLTGALEMLSGSDARERLSEERVRQAAVAYRMSVSVRDLSSSASGCDEALMAVKAVWRSICSVELSP